jgi:uncharacterized protein (TIGR03083 family)
VTTADPDSDVNWAALGREAAAALGETWRSLAEACHALAEQEWALPTECPGWDVKDQLSHVIGVERSILGEPAPAWDGPLGDHVRNDFGRQIEPWVAVRRAESGDAVLAEFVQVTRARLAELAQLDAAAWARVGPSPVGEVPYARFMETRVFDCWVHEQDARWALDRPGGSGGLASAFGLAQVQGAMPFVVGKKAAAPEGSVVRFEVGGPPGDARVFSIGVEGGRARPTADGAPPTVALALSSIDFVRLGCGRAAAGEVQAAGGIRLEGDAALGQRILDSMNFMF